MDYEALIRALCSDIVDKPDDIIIREMSVEDGKRRLFVIMTDDNDVAKLIGKGGKIIRSIREIVNLSAKMNKEFVDIKVENFEN